MGFRFNKINRLWLGCAIWFLLPTSGALAQGGVAVEAIAGEPVGVGRVTVDLPAEELPTPLGEDGLGLTEKDGRVLYPAMRNPMFGGLLREILGTAVSADHRRAGPRAGGRVASRLPGGPASSLDNVLPLSRRRAAFA